MRQAPETYQQWVDCFRALEDRPWDQETLELIRKGRYTGKASEIFLVRLSDTVGAMLSRCTQKFLHDLDAALSDGELDMAMPLAGRFQKNVRKCLIYRHMEFLEESYIKTLDEGFEKQLLSFWDHFMLQMNRSARENGDPQFEDMAQELRRVKMAAFRRA